MKTNANLLQLVGVFVIIIAATIVSAEYKHGTIKLLLIRPPSRLKVLLSKYFTVQLYSLFLIAVLFILSFILGAIFFGLNHDYVYLAYQNGEVIERSQFANMVSYYLAHCAMFVVLGTLSFAISTVFRSEAISIAISVLAYVVGASITSILMFFFDWAKYLLFANDPVQYFAETPTYIEGMSLGFSLTVLVIYWAIFLAVALIVFQKREVKQVNLTFRRFLSMIKRKGEKIMGIISIVLNVIGVGFGALMLSVDPAVYEELNEVLKRKAAPCQLKHLRHRFMPLAFSLWLFPQLRLS